MEIPFRNSRGKIFFYDLQNVARIATVFEKKEREE